MKMFSASMMSYDHLPNFTFFHSRTSIFQKWQVKKNKKTIKLKTCHLKLKQGQFWLTLIKFGFNFTTMSSLHIKP